MPTFVLTNAVVVALSIPDEELGAQRLSQGATEALSDHLARHGFELTDGSGFLLAP